MNYAQFVMDKYAVLIRHAHCENWFMDEWSMVQALIHKLREQCGKEERKAMCKSSSSSFLDLILSTD